MSEMPAGERRRVPAEHTALDEQVKLLVQVEQRLYRSQNELNRQLQNMRDLGAFALACSGADDVPTILERAVGVLDSAFTLDWAAALRLDLAAGAAEPARSELAGPAGTRALEPAEVEWLRTLPVLRLFHLPAGGADPRIDAFVARDWPVDIPPPAQRPGSLLFMTLRGAGSEPRALLMAYTTEKKRAMYWPADLSERNLPFLRLFANHLERALENSTLTTDLRERSDALTASLAALEHAQADLLQAQKMEAIGRLAGGIAHDFNNILTVILGYTRLIRDGLEPGAPRADDLQRVIVAGERAASITRQLLAFSRRQVQHRQPVDLNQLTGAMADMLGRLIGEHVRLALDLTPGLSPVWADPSHLEQVLLNLVVNARDAMPEGGEVRVSTRAATAADAARCDAAVDPRTCVVLEVSDDGVGMDETTRAHIFEPFYSTKEVGRGTGLGLAVVYGIVRQGEGHILVDSAPGRGARFTLLLPRSARPVPAETPVTPVVEAPPTRAGTVMVVEDEMIIRSIAREFLERAGYRVIEMADGATALQWLTVPNEPVDLVLSDVVMPRMGGVRLAEELARCRPGLPVVFISGYSREHALARPADPGRRAEPLPFVMKPFTRETLLGAVAETLRRSRGEG